MKKKYSILINTCDSYADIWPMFFHILKKTWGDEYPNIYLNTETLKYVDPDIEIVSLNVKRQKKNIQWGERLLDCLDRIEEDYVLFLLEDFFFEGMINTAIISDTLEILEKNENIAAFQYIPAAECYHGNYIRDDMLLEYFAKREKYGQFKIIAGPTMWRKKDLVALTRDIDTPWEWEYFGSYRTWFYGKEFYCWTNKEYSIFDYDVVHGGAVHRGKWVGYKVRELAEKYDFALDFGKREVEEDWMKQEKSTSKVPIIRRIDSIIKNRFKIVENILMGILLSNILKKSKG